MRQIGDRELEISIANMLRLGVGLSALIVLAGGAMYLFRQTAPIPDYSHFAATASPMHSVSSVLQGVVRLDPASIIGLGILVLIATPVVRVVYCVVGFARQRDGLYVGISAAVLAILLYSLTQTAR